MRKDLTWDNENKMYVPRLIHSFKNMFHFYITSLLILLGLLGALIILIKTPENYIIILMITVLYFSIDIVIKDYYRRKGLKNIIRFGGKC